MLDSIAPYLPATFVFSAIVYVLLAMRSARAAPDSLIPFFPLLIAILLGGTALSYQADGETTFAIGRVLTFFAAGFLPVVFYLVYREYTLGRPSPGVIVLLSLVPVATTILVLTNSSHHMIWTVIETADGVRFSNTTDHFWFNRVHAPFAYGLFAYSAIALAGRLPTIARGHRAKVVVLLVCAALPFAVSAANNVLRLGPQDFPFTAASVTVMLPFYAWLSLSMHVYRFHPFAYPTVFNHVRDPLIVLDMDERIVCANRSAETLLGAPERKLIGRLLWQDFPEARDILRQARALDSTQTLKLRTDRIYELSVAPLTGSNGKEQGQVVVCRDVTERRKALEKLAENEQLIRTLIETSSNGILRFARDIGGDVRKYRCVFANPAAESYLSGSGEPLTGVSLDRLEQLEPERLLDHFAQAEIVPGMLSYESKVETGSGHAWLRVVGEPVGSDLSVTLIDITQRKRSEDKMLADALRDPLTGVLNRRGFENRAAAGLAEQAQGAVLYLDLNQFKSINDRFGHQVGDALLKAFGHRLEFCLRPEDILGRLGGDEFAIVLPGIEIEDAKHVAERLVETASEAYIIQGQEIRCSASVGIALMPRHGDELWHLVSVADQAMYNAKSVATDDAANDRSAYIEAATAS